MHTRMKTSMVNIAVPLGDDGMHPPFDLLQRDPAYRHSLRAIMIVGMRRRRSSPPSFPGRCCSTGTKATAGGLSIFGLLRAVEAVRVSGHSNPSASPGAVPASSWVDWRAGCSGRLGPRGRSVAGLLSAHQPLTGIACWVAWQAPGHRFRQRAAPTCGASDSCQRLRRHAFFFIFDLRGRPRANRPEADLRGWDRPSPRQGWWGELTSAGGVTDRPRAAPLVAQARPPRRLPFFFVFCALTSASISLVRSRQCVKLMWALNAYVLRSNR